MVKIQPGSCLHEAESSVVKKQPQLTQEVQGPRKANSTGT